MRKIIFTGGGTAGHVVPNLALIPYFLPYCSVHYVGAVGGMEKDLVVKTFPDVIYHEYACTKLVRSFTLKNLALPIRFVKSVSAAKKLLLDIQPDVIFSKGGFVSLPLCLANKSAALILHESDSSLGLANRLSLKKADVLLTAFDTIKVKNAVQVGAPIKKELYLGDGERAKRVFDLDCKKRVLLVFGGSLGAKALNDFVFSNLKTLTEKYEVVHLTGKNETRKVFAPYYKSADFYPNMEDIYALNPLVLSRAGANTLFEVVALGLDCICVPLSKGSRGDQKANADYFAKKSALVSIDENDLSMRSFSIAAEKLKNNVSDFRRAQNMISIDGTEKIASIIAEKLRKKK
jgi:UDP-N-acetylglucosamine--N-acetylmuramyl-(pentapeptide) pyrophosphoryl-undecaprenol N-acetylglucosamine transferase